MEWKKGIFDQLTNSMRLFTNFCEHLKVAHVLFTNPLHFIFSNVYQKQAAQFFLLLLLLPFCLFFLSIDGETIPIVSLSNENYFEKCFGLKKMLIIIKSRENSGDRHDRKL